MRLFNVYKHGELVFSNMRAKQVKELTGMTDMPLKTLEVNQTKKKGDYVVELVSDTISANYEKTEEWQRWFAEEWDSICGLLKKRARSERKAKLRG